MYKIDEKAKKTTWYKFCLLEVKHFRKMKTIHDFCSQINFNSVLLFDLDGTLVHTDDANNAAYLLAIKEILGLDLENQLKSNLRITREKLSSLLPQASQEQFEQIIACKEKCFTRFLSYTYVNLELLSVLKKFQTSNELILITRSQGERAYEVLKYHGLQNYFHKIIFQLKDSTSRWSSKIPQLLKDEKYNLQDLFLFENEEVERVDAQKNGLKTKQIIIVNA